jgi:hypothetical protein
MKNLTLTLAVGLIAATSPLLAGVTVTPEPSTMLLMGGGLGVMILIARKVRARKK